MKFSNNLKASIAQAISATPPAPRPKKPRPPAKAKAARSRSPNPAAAKPPVQVKLEFPDLGTFWFLAEPMIDPDGVADPSDKAAIHRQFRTFCEACPATPWQELLPAWCADAGPKPAAQEEPDPEPDPDPEVEDQARIDAEVEAEAEPEPEPTAVPQEGGGPLVSAITGLLVPRWLHPHLPPGSRPLRDSEVIAPGTACFARLGDTWHPGEVIGMDADRKVSVLAANTPQHGLEPHHIRLLESTALPNKVLPVDFHTEPEAQADSPEDEEDEFAGLPDWVRDLAAEEE